MFPELGGEGGGRSLELKLREGRTKKFRGSKTFFRGVGGKCPPPPNPPP